MITDIGDAAGWYIDLWHDPGERITEAAEAVAQTVLFTSYTPLAEICEAGGHSWLYRMNYEDGSGIDDDEMGGEGVRDLDLGEGMASRPVVDIVNETAVIQSSNTQIIVLGIGNPYFRLIVKIWREDFDFLEGQ